MENTDKMVGQTTSALMVNADQTALYFVLKSGKIVLFDTYGDCCSTTWFADINGVDNLIGAEVVSVEEVEMPDAEDDDRGRQEVDKFYGIKITTDRGYVDIVYRNSSNGYYGGDVIAGDAAALPDGLVEIRENDWRA